MNQVEDLFKAQAGSFWETMMAHNGVAGYKIPEYQRQYNWNKEHLLRLFESALNGFYRLSTSNRPEYTFLGSIILVADNTREPRFDGVSLAIVDGQQRLTSLILLVCALFESIKSHRDDINRLSGDSKTWLEEEIQFHLNALYQCAVGQSVRFGSTTPFPRIVRDDDHRGDTYQNSEYRSAIGKFIDQFAKHYGDQKEEFEPALDSNSEYAKLIIANYNFMREFLNQSLYNGLQEGNTEDTFVDCNIVARETFGSVGLNSLFRRLGVLNRQSAKDRCLHEISRSDAGIHSEGLIRLVLFASYLNQQVVLTRVEAQNEADAFDIFDALNTTGEPLTALEACKPLLIRFEQEDTSNYRHEIRQVWETMERQLAEEYTNPAKRQTEMKQLLTSFALLFDGEKLPTDLKSQRTYLRSRFSNSLSNGRTEVGEFVRALSELAEFRIQYWEKGGIESLNISQREQDDGDILRLCLRFIADMNTSLAIPILARYWCEYGQSDEQNTFLLAVKAVVAFLILRRSVTQGTEGIDSDFRDLMSKAPKSDGDPLCMGQELDHSILSIDALRAELRSFLASSKIGVLDKTTWIRQAQNIPLANQSSRPLCRLLLFAAAHNARPDEKKAGLLTREGVRPGSPIDFLNYRNWVGQKYATLEHVAPDSGPLTGWDYDIYATNGTKHTIGNLVLLPERENNSIGNAGWEKKRVFYRALMSHTDAQREELITSARSEGYKFGRKTEMLIRNSDFLHMLDALRGVEDWTKDLIEERSKNILELAWEQISPWLFDN